MCSVPIRGVDSIGISKTNHKLGLSGLGYGKIDPIHKTSITKSAITDQAGLSHINTGNLGSNETQQTLNPIISNDFTNQKSQLEKELGNQVTITTEFGREIPKQIGDYAQAKEIELLAQGNIEEAQKWAEGGVYRVALHTITAALATGSIEGVVSAGGVAYSIPKIDDHLKEQGFDKQTRDTALLALSAGIGATAGGDTASVVNNVGQVRWNYLSHQQLKDKISCYGTKKDCAAHVAKYDEISRWQDEQLKNTCSSNPNSSNCHRMMQEALEYVGRNRNHYGKANDIKASTQNVLSVANSSGYHTINTLNERADYFGAMYDYTGQPWFRVAEKHSRGQLKIADNTGFSDWISEAGGAIMKNGKPEFQYIYQNYQNETNSWSYTRLHNEQYDPALQRIHEKHYNSWLPATQWYVDRQVGGEFLNPQHRLNTGCKDMTEVQGCQE